MKIFEVISIIHNTIHRVYDIKETETGIYFLMFEHGGWSYHPAIEYIPIPKIKETNQ